MGLFAGVMGRLQLVWVFRGDLLVYIVVSGGSESVDGDATRAWEGDLRDRRMGI